MTAPPPSAGQAAAFGRPEAGRGSFADGRPTPAPRPVPPPPAEALLRAFGAPAGQRGLRDPPGGRPDRRRTASGPWWKSDARQDPWRDPYAPAGLGAPAVYDEAVQAGPLIVDAKGRKKVRLRDVSVRLSVLVLLAVLLVGAVGGGVGWLLARTADETPLLAPGTTLSQVGTGRSSAPGSVAEIAAAVTPAVVSIEVRVGQSGATGSGVVIEGAKGYIVTNNHVVSGADGVKGAEIRAVFSDCSGSAARIVGRDPSSDIAVLKVEKPGLLTASLGKSKDVVVGDPVVAIGSPLGLAGTVTSGIVSALDRPVRLSGEGSDTNAVISAVQTDAPINPGNSGGALVNGSGAVIGINTAIASDRRRVDRPRVRHPDRHRARHRPAADPTGTAVHASLGVSTRSVTDGARDGALVLNVEPGSAADAAGIREQDIVIAVDGKRVGSSDELVVAIDAHDPGDKVTVEVVRGGGSREVQGDARQGLNRRAHTLGAQARGRGAAVFDSIGWGEIVVLALAALFIFGPERLPTLAKDAAAGLKKVREAITGIREQVNDSLGDDLARAARPRPAQVPPEDVHPQPALRGRRRAAVRPGARARGRPPARSRDSAALRPRRDLGPDQPRLTDHVPDGRSIDQIAWHSVGYPRTISMGSGRSATATTCPAKGTSAIR